MFFPYITGKNFAFRILVEVGLAAWVLLALYDRDYRPRFSWIAVFGTALLLIMFFADLFGEYAPKSFWSNFERMDGYVTLVHFFVYFLLLGTVIRTQRMWNYFLQTSLAVATYVAMYGLAQSTGMIAGIDRVDSTLGNAAYMAVYMLFHIFILLLLSFETRSWLLRILYSAVGVLFAYILLETGTRGTFIGLVVGLAVTVAYIALFGRKYPELRKLAVFGSVILIICAGTFYLMRDSEFVRNSGSLNRIASISIEKDLAVRTTIWGMAMEGVKQRPILGWGQSNFNYVFNTEYKPSLANQEQWFDRVHNIFFDWLIAGGILGFVAYFGILFSALYYLFWRPLFSNDDSFTFMERAVLLGILAGYFTHNLVVFDNIVSYMFYAVILAFIHNKVSTNIKSIDGYILDRAVVTTMVAPVVAVVAFSVIYLVNIPSILAAQDMIDALQTKDLNVRFAEFESALDRGSFADQEINEQLVGQALAVIQATTLTDEEKTKHLNFVESEFEKMIERKPNDARLHMIFASFYRYINRPDLALKYIDTAAELSPKKPQIRIERGFAYIQAGEKEKAIDSFKEAYELNPEYYKAHAFYIVGAMLADRDDLLEDLFDVNKLNSDKKLRQAFAEEDMLVTVAHETSNYELLKYILEARVEFDPNNAQERTNLAIAYYETGDLNTAVEILNQAIREIPSFKEQGEQFIVELNKGTVKTR